MGQMTGNWSVAPIKICCFTPCVDAKRASFILDMNREVDYTLLFSLNVAVAVFVL